MRTLQPIQAAGLTARWDGEKLYISPATRITANLRLYIMENKIAIINELRRMAIEQTATTDTDRGRTANGYNLIAPFAAPGLCHTSTPPPAMGIKQSHPLISK